jgi:hypothetical protein
VTLVLTEVSPFGLVMAADSAYTSVSTGEVRYGDKLFAIPGLRAGLSFWGGGLPGKPDDWIRSFLTANQSATSIRELGESLRDELRRIIPPLPPGQSRTTLGFHLGGVNPSGVPDVFHIHNGASTVLAARGELVDSRLVNCNNDLPPALFRAEVLGKGTPYILRNGDSLPYAAIWNQAGPWAETFAGFIQQAAGQGWTLDDRGRFVAAQIEVMRVLYSSWRQNRIAGTKAPVIGGAVRYLTLGANNLAPTVATAQFG